MLQHLSALHTWAGGFAERRLQLSRDATLTALLLRVWNLQEPLALQQSPDYWGCFSWGAALRERCCMSSAPRAICPVLASAKAGGL